MSTMLAGFHIGFDKAVHPWHVALWTVVSKQYLLPKSILSWFWSGLLTISLTCSCSWSMCSRLCTSPIRDASEQSTNASLLGMGDAALVSSSWLSTSEGPELPFNWARDSLFGVFLLPLQLFLLSMLVFKLMMSKQQQYSSWIQLNTHLHECNGSQKKNNQKVGNLIPSQCYPAWDAWCLSPLWKAVYRALLHPSWRDFDSQLTMGFLDSGKHLRKCQLLHNTLMSRDRWGVMIFEHICKRVQN